jgi:hypothetical protein
MRFVNLLLAATTVTGAFLRQRDESVDVQAEIDAYVPDDEIGKLALKGIEALQAHEEKRSVHEKRGGCNINNVSIRRDW